MAAARTARSRCLAALGFLAVATVHAAGPDTLGWWPNSSKALHLLAAEKQCISSNDLRVCSGQDTRVGGRLAGSSIRDSSSMAATQAQQWLTTLDGRVVQALVEWFQGGEPCSGSVSRSSVRVLYFCGGGTVSEIVWSGEPDEARMWATHAEWMRPPRHSLSCEIEVHVGVPGLCDLLQPPDWLERYQLLMRVDVSEEIDTEKAERRRAEELDATHRLIQEGWELAAARGEISVARLGELGAGLLKQATVAGIVSDSSRPRPSAPEASYDFTYGEISQEGVLSIVDRVGLNAESVVYDLGSGRGGATILLALASGAKSIGLELDASRHAAAVRLFNAGVRHGHINLDEAGRIELRFRDAFLPGGFNDATHVYMLSTCFGPHGARQSLCSVRLRKL